MTGPLRINRVHYPVESLGYGRRLGIWVQGCPLACKGCIAKDTWSPAGGEDIEIDLLVELWRRRFGQGADGLTISGGEPLAQPDALAELLAGVRKVPQDPARPADILVYTGYELPELDQAQHAALRNADVVITGRFRADQPTERPWRGSDNQRMLLRTPLGRQRYAEFVSVTAAHAPIQVHVDDGGIFLVGIPRHGDLAKLERALRANGVSVGSTSWRPQQPSTGDGPGTDPGAPAPQDDQ